MRKSTEAGKHGACLGGLEGDSVNENESQWKGVRLDKGRASEVQT